MKPFHSPKRAETTITVRKSSSYFSCLIKVMSASLYLRIRVFLHLASIPYMGKYIRIWKHYLYLLLEQRNRNWVKILTVVMFLLLDKRTFYSKEKKMLQVFTEFHTIRLSKIIIMNSDWIFYHLIKVITYSVFIFVHDALCTELYACCSVYYKHWLQCQELILQQGLVQYSTKLNVIIFLKNIYHVYICLFKPQCIKSCLKNVH